MFVHFLLSWVLGLVMNILLPKGEEWLLAYTHEKEQVIKDELYKLIPFETLDIWLYSQLDAAIPWLFEEAAGLLKGKLTEQTDVHAALSRVQEKAVGHPAFAKGKV